MSKAKGVGGADGDNLNVNKAQAIEARINMKMRQRNVKLFRPGVCSLKIRRGKWSTLL